MTIFVQVYKFALYQLKHETDEVFNITYCLAPYFELMWT